MAYSIEATLEKELCEKLGIIVLLERDDEPV